MPYNQRIHIKYVVKSAWENLSPLHEIPDRMDFYNLVFVLSFEEFESDDHHRLTLYRKSSVNILLNFSLYRTQKKQSQTGLDWHKSKNVHTFWWTTTFINSVQSKSNLHHYIVFIHIRHFLHIIKTNVSLQYMQDEPYNPLE